jgi:hypothetical protein
MLRKIEYMTGIFVRRSAECFAVILNPIATMLLVNGHCKQSDTIPIVFNQNGSNGFVAAPDDAVWLLTDEGRINAGHRRTHYTAAIRLPHCRCVDANRAETTVNPIFCAECVNARIGANHVILPL